MDLNFDEELQKLQAKMKENYILTTGAAEQKKLAYERLDREIKEKRRECREFHRQIKEKAAQYVADRTRWRRNQHNEAPEELQNVIGAEGPRCTPTDHFNTLLEEGLEYSREAPICSENAQSVLRSAIQLSKETTAFLRRDFDLEILVEQLWIRITEMKQLQNKASKIEKSYQSLSTASTQLKKKLDQAQREWQDESTGLCSSPESGINATKQELWPPLPEVPPEALVEEERRLMSLFQAGLAV
jgi:hypothetical protein